MHGGTDTPGSRLGRGTSPRLTRFVCREAKPERPTYFSQQYCLLVRIAIESHLPTGLAARVWTCGEPFDWAEDRPSRTARRQRTVPFNRPGISEWRVAQLGIAGLVRGSRMFGHSQGFVMKGKGVCRDSP